jgi:hypothetical protein
MCWWFGCGVIPSFAIAWLLIILGVMGLQNEGFNGM